MFRSCRATMYEAGEPLLYRAQQQGDVRPDVSIDDVLFFQAEDKYVRVGSVGGDVHIRTPLKAMIDKLDPDVFWQIHRGTVVRLSAIKRVVRDDDQRLRVVLKDSADSFPVSASFEHRFKGM